ncbi:hypothetical protein [Streptomyces himastatinicus]|nr:hypothetical protein [Streptomyces himastatinicus]
MATATASPTAPDARLDRRRFVADLVARLPEDALVVTGLGSPSYDVCAAGDRPGTFYLWGAMGAAAPLALGVALAKPDRPVLAESSNPYAALRHVHRRREPPAPHGELRPSALCPTASAAVR